MADDPTTPVDLMRALTRAERLLARRVGAVLTTEGLTVEAWRVLCRLADGQGHPMSEVSTEESLPPGTLTKIVDQLVDQNLVHRRIDPFDRRRIRAYLTPGAAANRNASTPSSGPSWPGSSTTRR